MEKNELISHKAENWRTVLVAKRWVFSEDPWFVVWAGASLESFF
jgi:hypothetical protein